MLIFKLVKSILSKQMFVHGRIYKVIIWAAGLNLFFGTLFYFVERDVQEGITWVDSVWWTMVTMTTVGYGDYYPQTFIGRFVIAYPSMLIGIGIMGYLVGVIAEAMFDRTSKKRKGIMAVKSQKHIIVCNCPSIEKILFLAEEIRADHRFENGDFVVVTDKFDEIPTEFLNNKIKFIKGGPTKEEILMKANILECAGVFVLAENPTAQSSDERTFSIGTIIECISIENKVDIKVVVELVNDDNHKMMVRSKVDGIVSLTGVTDCLLIQEFLDPGTSDAVGHILSNKVGSQIYTAPTKLKDFSIKMLKQEILERDSRIVVIGIRRDSNHYLNPKGDFKIEVNDEIILLAEDINDFNNFENELLS